MEMDGEEGGGHPLRYAIIRVFPRYSIRIHPLTEALPHFVAARGGREGGRKGRALSLFLLSHSIPIAIVRHPVLHELPSGARSTPSGGCVLLNNSPQGDRGSEKGREREREERGRAVEPDRERARERE